MVQKKCAVLFSGGKDSCLALHLAKQNGYDIKYLLSVIPENFDSFMFHKPYLNLLEEQAEMLGVDLLVVGSEGVKEKEVDDLGLIIGKVKDEIDVVVVGGIASDYQGGRIKKVCSKLNLEFYAPLLGFPSEQIWEELLNEKFKVILTKISCEGLSKDFLGKIIDRKRFNELKRLGEKYKFRIDFEGGEAESAVIFMPGFSGEIFIEFEVESEGKYRHFLKIRKVK